MKRIIIYLLALTLYSCSYNSFEDKGIEEADCSGVSFSASISPIISTNCALPQCHGGSPFLPDFREFSIIQSKAAKIRTRTQNRSMPQIGSLTQQEIDLIACWVDDGALDN